MTTTRYYLMVRRNEKADRPDGLTAAVELCSSAGVEADTADIGGGRALGEAARALAPGETLKGCLRGDDLCVTALEGLHDDTPWQVMSPHDEDPSVLAEVHTEGAAILRAFMDARAEVGLNRLEVRRGGIPVYIDEMCEGVAIEPTLVQPPAAPPAAWRVVCGGRGGVDYDSAVESESDAERIAAQCRRAYGEEGSTLEVFAAGVLRWAWDYRIMDTGRGAARWLPRVQQRRGLSPDEALELQDKLQEYFELHRHAELRDYGDYEAGYRALFSMLLGGPEHEEYLHDGRPVEGVIVAKLGHRLHEPGQNELCDECADHRLAEFLASSPKVA